MATTNIQSFPGDVTITSNLTVDTNTLHVDSVSNRVGIGSTLPQSKLDVGQRCRIYSNLTVGNTFHVDTHENRIGIGTTLPSEALVVNPGEDTTARFGNLDIFSSGGSAFISAANYSDTANFAIRQEDKGAGKHTSINHPSGRKIIFRDTNSATDQSAMKGGNFGIQTADPKFPLDVNGEVRQNLPFFYGRTGSSSNFANGGTLQIDGIGANVLNRNNYQVTVPSGANGIYHIYGVMSFHANSSSYEDRGVTFQTARDRGGTITTYANSLQWIMIIDNSSSYRQCVSEVILDLQSGDKVYWDATDKGGSTVHTPNFMWYVRMISPT